MTLDKELVETLQRDYRSAAINEQERTMLDYVMKLTKDATKVSPDDHAKLTAPRRLPVVGG